MAGIYIHIPFCKQACNYCNFYFVTSLNNKEQFISSLLKEIELQKHYLGEQTVYTIYFGGGTPSLLSYGDFQRIFEHLYRHFNINLKECTIECNPDDLTQNKITELKSLQSGVINRLSIGVQSFFDEDLKFMQRAHNASEAELCIQKSLDAGFNSLTIDLIYGTPTMSNERWFQNLEKISQLGIQHLSSYALTVEQKTKLHRAIKEKKLAKVEDEHSAAQFDILLNWAEKNSFEQYEISNFAIQNNFAIHNTNYWKGIPYLGLGPSAHSFDGESRHWNVANVFNYQKSIAQNIPPITKEILSAAEKTNEYLMTSLRTMWGCDLRKIHSNHRAQIEKELLVINSDFYVQKNETIVLTNAGKHFADYIASTLFID
jgi:oxygen-independent coproporphyrinogen-3 oxidase